MKKEETTFDEVEKIARMWSMAKDVSEAIVTLKLLKDKDSNLSVGINYRSHKIVWADNKKEEIAEEYKKLINQSLKVFKERNGVSYYELLKQNKIK